MLAFCHGTFKARIEGVSGEEREGFRLAFEGLAMLVEIAECFETSDTSNRLSRSGLYMVDIIVMDEAEVWGASVIAACIGDRFWTSLEMHVECACLQCSTYRLRSGHVPA